MRNIKFRARYKGQGWHYFTMTDLIIGRAAKESLAYDSWDEWTGYTDKDGRAIYEGDIVAIADTWMEPILDDGTGPREDFSHLAPVMFQAGSFGVHILENGESLKRGFIAFPMLDYELGMDGLLEVVGNIVENPEMLV